MTDCPLCHATGEELLWRNDELRVIHANEPAWPGFCRVIWQVHVREMSDLDAGARERLMRAVWAVEAAVREVARPDKINLASLGNVVPHLHWHVIPRFRDDSHFPDPVWAAPRRAAPARPVDPEQLRAAVIRHLSGG